MLRQPTSDLQAYGNWTGTPGSRHTVVDDYPGIASYLTHGPTDGAIVFGFNPFNLPSQAANIVVYVEYYDRREKGEDDNITKFAGRLKVGGSYYNTAMHNLNVEFAARQNSWPINPKTGTVWTVSEIEGSDPDSSLQGFGVVSTDAIPDAQLACIRLRVEYTASAVLSVTSAPLTLTGQAFAMKLDRKLTVTSAGLTLTGKNIEFLMESRMVVEPGGLILTPWGVTLRHQRMEVTAAALLCRAQEIAFVTSYFINVEAAAATLNAGDMLLSISEAGYVVPYREQYFVVPEEETKIGGVVTNNRRITEWLEQGENESLTYRADFDNFVEDYGNVVSAGTCTLEDITDGDENSAGEDVSATKLSGAVALVDNIIRSKVVSGLEENHEYKLTITAEFADAITVSAYFLIAGKA